MKKDYEFYKTDAIVCMVFLIIHIVVTFINYNTEFYFYLYLFSFYVLLEEVSLILCMEETRCIK